MAPHAAAGLPRPPDDQILHGCRERASLPCCREYSSFSPYFAFFRPVPLLLLSLDRQESRGTNPPIPSSSLASHLPGCVPPAPRTRSTISYPFSSVASRTVSCTKKRKRTTMRLILLYLSRKYKRRYVVTGRQWRTCTDRESFATTTNVKAEASQGLSPAMSFSPAQMKRSAERWRTRTRPGEKRRMARLYDIYRV
ncbi:hypothetical protein GOODEAATRI_002300 [Goodea atripinnis]|uniref:Uncharacterized protein n=1 Tax=Goodea atripinnis TaxID=208336 RepID=A0ABV0PV52_9TELE